MGTLIQVYEEEHYPIPDETGAGVLRIPMDKHGLTQSNRPEVDSRDVVSESLRGKRELDVRQIRLWAQKSGVSSAMFD